MCVHEFIYACLCVVFVFQLAGVYSSDNVFFRAYAVWVLLLLVCLRMDIHFDMSVHMLFSLLYFLLPNVLLLAVAGQLSLLVWLVCNY